MYVVVFRNSTQQRIDISENKKKKFEDFPLNGAVGVEYNAAINCFSG